MNNFQKAYNRLNPQQKQAVDKIDGPVLVVAGPGTGKTQILTLRIANIIDKTDTNPENILALTFTENAAINMKRRLAEFIGPEAYKVKITTFHSFCNDIINENPELFAFKDELKLLDDLEKYRLIQSIINKFDSKQVYDEFQSLFNSNDQDDYKKKTNLLRPFGAPYLYQNFITQRISELKREYILPEKFKELIKLEIEDFNEMDKLNKKTKKPTGKWNNHLKLIKKNIEFYSIYKSYQEEIKNSAKFDYDDMIAFVNEKFETNDDLLGYYQEQYLYVLADEYQDTNGAQNQILTHLGSWDDHPNIFVVGDDDQSIFRFQGASITNILEFKEKYPESEIITITTNYRSNQEILDLASELINNNTERLNKNIEGLDKNLKAFFKHKDLKLPEILNLTEYSKGEVENYAIAQKIKELKNKGVEYDEIAIIYTKHKHGEEILDYLLAENIPINIVTNTSILNEKLIQNIIKTFNSLQDLYSNEKLAEVLKMDFLKINRIDSFRIFHIFQKIRKEEKHLLELLLNEEKLNKQNISDSKSLRVFGEKMIDLQSYEINHSFVQFFHRVIEDLGITEWVKENENFDNLNSLKSLSDFIKSRNNNDNKYDLSKFLEDIKVIEESNLKIEKEDFKSGEKGVNLLTAHASKGLEFDYIFIPKAIEGNWSNKKFSNKLKLIKLQENVAIDKIQEERRLFFVAITRAKKALSLSYANEYLKENNNYKETTPSQFINELNITDSNIIQNVPEENKIKEILETTLQTHDSLNLKTNEKEYLKSLIENYQLSITHLNNYLEDPQIFLYENLLRIPKAKTKNLSMGTAVHASLEYFYRKLKNGEKKDLNYILFTFEKALEKEFLGEEEYESTLEEGKRILTEWYEAHDNEFTKPVYTEYSLKNVYLNDIALQAKIDKVEWIDKKEKIVKVIDYKTGAPKTSGSIKKPIDGNKDSNYYRQLVFYKLITDLDPRFQYQVRETELEFIKLDKGKIRKVTFEIPDEDIENLKEIIKEVMQKIRNLEF